MSGVEDRWREIAAAFDEDENLDPAAFLRDRGIEGLTLAERIADASPELMRHALLPDDHLGDIEFSKYRIVRPLDQGGQGQVYLAERSDGIYQQSVVIKFLPSRFSGEAARERFFREMQFLADLRHPGIVPIIDAGLTDQGQPWLVLEYIDGLHIDAFCHTRSLDHADTVRLFTRLCDALDFIHLRNVVHLDLKPGNILVREANGIAYPVIIDFGVSSRLEDQGDEPMARYGTRGFAAPEQGDDRPVDGRADLYALGMMLAVSLPGVDATALLDTPGRERDSLLRRQGVPRDLVQVIRTCTRPNPADRYDDAASLRWDLNNWLQGFPLAANRHRPFHVLARAIRRHPVFTSITVFSIMLLAAGVGRYTADIRTLQQATQAEKNAGDELYNFVLTDLFDRLVRIGRVDTLALVAERGVQHLEEQDPRIFDDNTRLQTALAYKNSGRVFDQLESSDKALQAYDRAEGFLEDLRERPGFREPYLRHLAAIDILRAETLATTGQGELTEKSLLRALDLAAQLPDTETLYAMGLFWEAHLLLGWYYMEYDRPEAAETHIKQSIDAAQSGLDLSMGDTALTQRWRLHLSHGHQAAAWFAFDYATPEEALASIDVALGLARQTVDAFGQDIQFLSNYRVLLNHKAFMLQDAGDLDSAQQVVEQAITAGERLALMAPGNIEYLRELAYTLTTGGEVAEAMGNMEQALALYRRGLQGSREVAARDVGGYSSANDLAIDLTSVANLLAQLDRTDEARKLWSEAVDLMAPVRAAEPDNKYYTYSLVIPLIQLGRYSEAAPMVAMLRGSGMEDETLQALLSEHNLD